MDINHSREPPILMRRPGGDSGEGGKAMSSGEDKLV